MFAAAKMILASTIGALLLSVLQTSHGLPAENTADGHLVNPLYLYRNKHAATMNEEAKIFQTTRQSIFIDCGQNDQELKDHLSGVINSCFYANMDIEMFCSGNDIYIGIYGNEQFTGVVLNTKSMVAQ